jgi:hypothetical protein
VGGVKLPLALTELGLIDALAGTSSSLIVSTPTISAGIGAQRWSRSDSPGRRSFIQEGSARSAVLCHSMKALGHTLVLLVVLSACSGEKPDSASPAPADTNPPSTAAQPNVATSSESAESTESAGEAVDGVWAGQVKIDAHAGVAWLNYVGAESGDFVPMRFRPDSEAGRKILAACADDDLCEVEGTVKFLDEPPPENASAIGEVVRVARVRKLPDA